jgi:hypothetical protein
MPFPAKYYGSPQQLADLEFLVEIQNLGLQVPRRVAEVLWDAYEKANDEDARRSYAARIMGEFAQAAELFSLLVLSVRRRDQAPILVTFVDHQTADLVLVMDEFAATPNATIGQLLHAPEPGHTEKTKELFEAVAAAGQKFAAVFSANSGVLRRFYTKTKHGFPITRSFDTAGPPFFGPNPDLGVWAVYRRPAAEGGDLATVGFRASAELTERLVQTVATLTVASVHLAGLIRGGIEQKKL